MPISIDLEKLTLSLIVFCLFLMACFVCSGALFLFVFYRELFVHLEITKLILLSAAISIPIFLTSFCFIGIISIRKAGEKSKELMDRSAIISIIGSSLIFYIVIALGFFLGLKGREVIPYIIEMELIVILFACLLQKCRKKEST